MGGESSDFYYKLFLDFQQQNFNVFTGYDDEPIISFDPSSAIHKNSSVSQTFDDDEIDGNGVEVLSGVCHQVRGLLWMVFS